MFIILGLNRFLHLIALPGAFSSGFFSGKPFPPNNAGILAVIRSLS
jgi:hypothetical protein